MKKESQLLVRKMKGYYERERKKSVYFLSLIEGNNGAPAADTTQIEEKVRIFDKILGELKMLEEMEEGD